MSIIKYWPLPIVGWALFSIAVLGLGIGAVVRSKMAAFQHWPYWLGAGLLVVGTGLIVVWAYRPHFLTAPKPPDSISTVEEFEAHINRLIDSGGTPGVSVAVVKDGVVVYEAGFGIAGPDRDLVSAETVYRWWSITKVFTAVTILQLAENGVISLDDPVSEYLDFFDLSREQPDAAPITIHQLLTHSSGMPDAGIEILGWIHFDGDQPLNQTELLAEKLVDFQRLDAEPGEEGRYTNIGYMALAAIVEQTTGETYETYVADNILSPLSMRATGFEYTENMKQEARGSHPVDVMTIAASFIIDMDRAVDTRQNGLDWFNRVYPDQTGPSGLIGSPLDMTKFMAALLNSGELGGTRILSPASVEAMNTRYLDVISSPAPVEGLGFGYAWFYDNTDGRISLTHGGQGAGTASMMRIYPDEGLGIVIVSNSTYLGRRFGFDEVELLGDIDW